MFGFGVGGGNVPCNYGWDHTGWVIHGCDKVDGFGVPSIGGCMYACWVELRSGCTKSVPAFKILHALCNPRLGGTTLDHVLPQNRKCRGQLGSTALCNLTLCYSGKWTAMAVL